MNSPWVLLNLLRSQEIKKLFSILWKIALFSFQVLAAGLSGLYSLLPRKLSVQCVDWFRFAADDVYEVKELTNFMNSLEFCNVVIQVCHPSIRDQLFDYIYQGFLVPVMGPALLQVRMYCVHVSVHSQLYYSVAPTFTFSALVVCHFARVFPP